MIGDELYVEVGDVRQLAVDWKVGTALTDPGTVLLRIRKPSTTTPDVYTYGTSPNVGKSAIGSYYGEIVFNEAGRWYYRWEGTTPAAGVAEGQVVVAPSPFFPGSTGRALLSVDDLKAYVRAPDGMDDTEIARLVRAASEAIMIEAGREFVPLGTNPQTRRIVPTVTDSRLGKVRIGDWTAVTGVTVENASTGLLTETLAASTWRALPLAPRPEWQPITHIEFLNWYPLSRYSDWEPTYQLAVTGTAGFAAVPDTVRQWAIETVRFWFDRDLESFSETVTDTGQIIRPKSLPGGVLAGIRSAYHEPSIA